MKFPTRFPQRPHRRAASLVATLCLPLLFGACGQKKPEELLASAKTFLAKNDRKAAVIQIKNAIQADPESAEARFLFGSTLLDGGDPVQAEVELRKALRLHYPADLVVPKLASSLLAQGQAKKLIDEFGSPQLGSAAAKADLSTSLAIAYAGVGDVPKAEAVVAEALALEPQLVPALLFRARLRLARNDLPGAAAVVADALKSAPDSGEAWKLKGDVDLLRTQDVDLALRSYRKAVEVQPNFAQGHVSIVKALVQQQKLDESQQQVDIAKQIAPRDPQVQYVAALVAFLKKDLKRAQEQIDELLKVAPDSPPVLVLAGSIELDTNATLQAQAHLARAIELSADDTQARRLLMSAYLRSGQPDQAVAVLTRGRAGKEVEPVLYSVAGDAYLQTGDARTAQAYFEKAAKLDPKDLRKRTSLAIAHLNTGDIASGFDELRETAAADTGISADVALVNAYLGRQQFDQALAAIDALARKDAGRPLAPYLRGNALLGRRDAAGARKNFEQALSLDPAYFPAVMALTSLDVADRRYAEAKSRVTGLLDKDPKNAKLLMALAGVESAAGATRNATAATIARAIAAAPTDAMARLALVDLHLRANDPKQALVTAQEALTALPDHPAVLENLGRVQQQTGDIQQAIKTFTRLTELQPKSPNAFTRLAQAQIAAKSVAQAESSLARAIELQPDFLPAQRLLAAVYADSGRSAAALKLARAIQGQRPKDSTGYKLEGDLDAFNKDLPGAAAAYRAGLKQAPSTDLAVALHSVLLRAANTAEADRFAADWQRQAPEDPIFVFHLGDEAMRRKDFPAAEAAYTKVTQLEPRNAAAFNNLAWTAAPLKRDNALSMAEKANELAPGQAAFVDTLAAAWAGKGDYARAIETQKKAIDLEPADSSLKLNLAKWYLASGDKPKAQAQLLQLQQLGSGFAAQAEVAQLLKSM